MPLPKDPSKHEEYRLKLSRAHTGKPKSESHRQNIRNGLKGIRRSQESIRKQRESISGENHPNFGKHLSEATRKKIGDSHRGEKSVNFGKHLPEATCKKIAEARTGKTLSDESKLKCSRWQIGVPKSYGHRLRIVESMLGGFWYGNVRYYDGPQYCEKWTPELRQRVRAFFGYRCVECGAPQGKRLLHVHHVWYNKKTCCDNSPRSLVSLCGKCHIKTTTGNRAYWSTHFQEMIDVNYNGKCWFTKDEMKELETKTLLGD